MEDILISKKEELDKLIGKLGVKNKEKWLK